MINFSDIVEANGKTIKENNTSLPHNIPIGTLVEVNIHYSKEHGIRLFVCSHDRDCDGTPLYSLSFKKDVSKEIESLDEDLKKYERHTSDYAITHWALTNNKGSITGGFPEDSLIIIK